MSENKNYNIFEKLKEKGKKAIRLTQCCEFAFDCWSIFYSNPSCFSDFPGYFSLCGDFSWLLFEFLQIFLDNLSGKPYLDK